MSKLHLGPNPTLGDIQKYVDDMETERGFDKNSVVQKCLMLCEEVGELCKALRKSHGGMRYDTAKTYKADAAEEIADIVIILSAIANRLGVDIEQAFRDKEARNKQREWR